MDILILRHRWNVLAAAAILILGLALGPVHAASVMESARDIPIAASADVVVDGSSTAVAAAEGGAKVYLIANGIEKEHDSRAYCLNDADGIIVWQQDIEATVQQIKVLETWKKLDYCLTSTPALAGGFMYFRGSDCLWCYDLRKQ